MRLYMQTPVAENQPPRYYHLHLEQDLFEGWIVTKEWGAQGSSGRVLKKYFKTIDEAEDEITSSRDKQIKRGYRVVFIEGQNNPQ
ncbi:MAG: WGR domain-containing protein [Gammaproteobacteria bacterium]|nr:WGR domain-containing protein [Gammaproteobacteria bacterium]